MEKTYTDHLKDIDSRIQGLIIGQGVICIAVIMAFILNLETLKTNQGKIDKQFLEAAIFSPDFINDTFDCYFEHHCILGHYCEITDRNNIFSMSINEDQGTGEVIMYEEGGAAYEGGIKRVLLTGEIRDKVFYLHRWDLDADMQEDTWELLVCNNNMLSFKASDGQMKVFRRLGNCSEELGTFELRLLKAFTTPMYND